MRTNRKGFVSAIPRLPAGMNIFAEGIVIEGGRKIRTSEDWIKFRHKGVNSC